METLQPDEAKSVAKKAEVVESNIEPMCQPPRKQICVKSTPTDRQQKSKGYSPSLLQKQF
jgi:hypothetical protein